MNNDEKTLADNETDAEEIIDFEFDELSNDGDAEEVIELVDVVERGEEPIRPGFEARGSEGLGNKELSPEEVEVEKGADENFEWESETEDVSDSGLPEPVENDVLDLVESEETSLMSGGEGSAGLEGQNQDVALESALERMDAFEEDPSSQEWAEPGGEAELEELIPLADEEEVSPMPETKEMPVKLPAEDLSAIPVPEEEDLGMAIGEEVSVFEGATGISEKRIEEILTQAVREAVKESLESVLERVAGEAMRGVAERLITDAIQALKESLTTDSK